MFISAVLRQVLPAHRRSGAGGPARKGEPRRAASTSAPASPRRAGHGSPRGSRVCPAEQVRILTASPRSPRGTGAGLCTPRPAPPRLRRSRRDTEEFRGGRPVPGWSLRDGRVSLLWGRAEKGQRVPQSRRSLGYCRRSDFARGRPWGGRAEPPRCLRPAASPRSGSAASRSGSDPRGARPGPSRAVLGVLPRAGTAALPHRLKIPPGRRVWQRREARSVFPAWRSGCGASTRMKDMDNIKTVKKEWVCKSGTDDQILNGTEQNCDYFVDNLFEEAQKVGAMCVPPTTVKNQVDVIIKLWKNGFTVNDGELRSYTDVANQQFLESIKKGELPFELQKVFDKEEIEVKVEDKKDKVYLSSKKPMFHPFSGHGYRLGSATPKIISKVGDSHPGPDDKRHLPLVPLNDLEPVTNVQIWLADGERIIQKFNVSHRISHVRDFITKYQGSEGSVPFTLTTSLPFQELQDETLTLEEAKLQNAVVVQRLRKTAEPFRLFVIEAPDNDYKTAATPNGQLSNEQKNAVNSTRPN